MEKTKVKIAFKIKKEDSDAQLPLPLPAPVKTPRTKKGSKKGSKKGTIESATTEFPPLIKEEDNIIISFDVGIINLAYCVMSWNETDGLQIYDWNIINMANGNPQLKCSKCTNKAYYIDECDNNKWCLTHGKTQIRAGKTLERNVTVANVTEFELKSRLFHALDNNPIFLVANTVLVENQPLKGMEKIRGIGHALFDYFVLRGTIDKGKEYKSLQFLNAKNKLTVYDGPPITCSLKTQYARNKWYAVKYCSWAIQTLPSILNYFENFKQKKDDLADCMLQGLWYLKFGQEGKKAPLTSNHQKLVYGENNIVAYNKVRPYAPTAKSLKSGKLTLSNIKYILTKKVKNPDCLTSSIDFYFNGISSASAFEVPPELRPFIKN